MKKIVSSRGHTLSYVLVFIILLIITIAVLWPSGIKGGKSRFERAEADIATLLSALVSYRLDNQAYPSTLQGLSALVMRPIGCPSALNWQKGGYISDMVRDPWGRAYIYINDENKKKIEIYSLGLDGKVGGAGAATDIYGSAPKD